MKIADRSKDKNGKFKYNKSKQIRAFMPNLIHSLDADALALLVYYYFTDNSSNIKNIYTIHDCFAVTANNTENLINFLKVVYQKIYTERSYLKELHKTMIEHIKLHYNDDCIDENLYINTEPYKGYFPNIDDIVGKDDSKGFIEKASYLLS
jgi:DNA-directed RNA polymerase